MEKTQETVQRILLEPYKYLLQLPAQIDLCQTGKYIRCCATETMFTLRVNRGHYFQNPKRAFPFRLLTESETFFHFGKQVRTKLSQAFNHWLKVPEDKLQIIIEVTEMLHNASLLIDDIEDNSKLRRGFPVAHSIYGIPSVINSANYVYFLGLEKVLTLNHPDAVKLFTRQLLELHQGQGLDIYWRDNYTCPTEEEYKAMVLQKTGGLFGLAVGLMQLFSDYKEDLKPLLDTLGLFFQIRDDYANLHSKEYSENKSFCEDLTEGKFSFPTIHAIWSRPESTQVQNILRQRTENIDIKKYCVHYLENVGSFEYTRNTLKELESKAYKQIDARGGNPELVALIKHLSKMFKEENE